MASTKTLYKSVTLELGEQFVLPPNSVLIGAEDISSIDSTCTLPTLDSIACYTALLTFQQSAGNTSEPWELENGSYGGNIQLKGFAQKPSSSIAVETLFTNPYTFSFSGMVQPESALETELSNKLPGAFNIQAAQHMDSRQYNLYVTIKTTASVASSLFLTTTTEILGITTLIYTPFKEHSVYETYPGLPTCTNIITG